MLLDKVALCNIEIGVIQYIFWFLNLLLNKCTIKLTVKVKLDFGSVQYIIYWEYHLLEVLQMCSWITKFTLKYLSRILQCKEAKVLNIVLNTLELGNIQNSIYFDLAKVSSQRFERSLNHFGRTWDQVVLKQIKTIVQVLLKQISAILNVCHLKKEWVNFRFGSKGLS